MAWPQQNLRHLQEHMRVNFPKAAVVEMKGLLEFLNVQNHNFIRNCGEVLETRLGSKCKPLITKVDDIPLKLNKSHIFLAKYKFDNIPVHMLRNREKHLGRHGMKNLSRFWKKSSRSLGRNGDMEEGSSLAACW